MATVAETLDACLAEAQMVPMQRTLGSGFAIQSITMVALPVELWEQLVAAINAKCSR